MATTSFFAHRQRLVSVFKDTMEQIQQSQDCQEAISYSISHQQFISQEQAIDLPEMKYDTPAEIRVSRLRSLEAAAQYQGQHYFRTIEFAVYCRTKDAKNYEAFCPLADMQREV